MQSKQKTVQAFVAVATVILIMFNYFAIRSFRHVSAATDEFVSPTSVVVSGSDSTTEATLQEESTPSETSTSATEPVSSQTLISPYKIIVYIGTQSVVAYKVNEDGSLGKQVKRFTCSTGAPSTPTSVGEYEIKSKQRWCSLQGSVYGQFCSYIGAHYLFHSVPYQKKDPSTLENEEYDALGTRASMGCIRMCVRDCKWIYDNMPVGTPVTITNSKGPRGAGFPKRKKDPIYDGWDPSDRWAKGNPYFDKDAATKTSAADGETSATGSTSTTAPSAATSTTTTAAPPQDPQEG